jgi:hypothetical protein
MQNRKKIIGGDRVPGGLGEVVIQHVDGEFFVSEIRVDGIQNVVAAHIGLPDRPLAGRRDFDAGFISAFYGLGGLRLLAWIQDLLPAARQVSILRSKSNWLGLSNILRRLDIDIFGQKK